MRHVITLTDLSDVDICHIVARGCEFAAEPGQPSPTLDGAIVGTYFRKTSTRTRTGFTAGALRLGGRVIAYGPDDLQLNTGETVADTARVLGRMVDILVARTAGTDEELREWAAPDGISVVNAMSAAEHPTQALADLTTLQATFGGIDSLRVLYVGEGNNTAAALALALTRFPTVHLELRTPLGYGLAPTVQARARRQAAASAATFVERHDMDDLPAGCDVVYTTRWQTTGTSKPDPDWRRLFAPFQVDATLWKNSPDARFMHDLPAHRGEEVTADVLDGPASIAFDQAANKMFSAMAVLEWCYGGRGRR
ncbi:MAG TPA: ornithine carbamoyltransferase [Asanoa sp.]|jgi:ornithine carbamoyltransferase|nr:ornithine carbamoyltransferase [Asanoa sp.]